MENNRRFGGTCRLHLQGRRISQERNHEASRRLNFNGLHGVISQKTVLFITTAVRTSNSTLWTLHNLCVIKYTKELIIRICPKAENLRKLPRIHVDIVLCLRARELKVWQCVCCAVNAKCNWKRHHWSSRSDISDQGFPNCAPREGSKCSAKKYTNLNFSF
jgi:hypothetical protein